MYLDPYIDRLRGELAAAAEAGDDKARAVAEQLTRPLESATRLILLDVLSAAADEITRELAPGTVEVRLRGGEPQFVVTPPPSDDLYEELPRSPEADSTTGPPPTGGPRSYAASADGEEGGTARLNLRLIDTVKQRIEEAAREEGLSLNAWLVRAAASALGTDAQGRQTPQRDSRGGQSYTGWVR